jgi:hypothetical protein
MDAPPEEPGRPSVGELLALPPAWPREWAQRLGREAADLGGRPEVHRSSDGEGWEVWWMHGRRRLLALRPDGQGVRVQLALGEPATRRVLSDPGVEEEFRAQLAATASVRGRRHVEVALGSARRLNAVVESLRAEVHFAGGP